MGLRSKLQPTDKDRISALPDEVLFHILSFIPTIDVLMTSILSKRWKNIWVSVPNLDFTWYDVDSGFEIFVNHVLLLRDSSDIKSFCLNYFCDEENSGHVDGWIRTVVQHNVVELDLSVFTSDEFEPYEFQLPKCVFTCKTLVVLKLRSDCFTYAPPTSECFPSLMLLHVCAINSGSLMEKLFSHCPVLEDLTINGIHEGVEVLNFNISAPKLKTLNLLNLLNTCR